MKINNPRAIEVIQRAIKTSELDCCLWDEELCRELASEILVALDSLGLFVVEL